MNYKLAKQLKDAGFPFHKRTVYQWEKSNWAWLPCDEITKDDREKLWIPSLEEIIDACEKEFYSLTYQDKEKGGWIARTYTNREIEKGKTPSEAVAKLWLKLQ